MSNQKFWIEQLKSRFQQKIHRHPEIAWEEVQQRIENQSEVIAALKWMEETGGEPDVIGTDESGRILFADKRYGRTFIYHNGADSYYSSRGFRGILKV